jgi:disulfide oxidoreductase YuzD
MKSVFPGEVDVSYLDVFSPQVRDLHRERMQQFEERSWPYPISMVDGQVVSIGSVSVFALARAVERVRRRGVDER